MKTRYVPAFVIAAIIAATAAAFAQEKIELKPGPGRDQVMGYCVACHSLDYIQMNSPFLDRKGWEATVAKMSKAYGAPVPPEDAPAIAAYLAKHYGKR